jgi:hypothetical protein
VLDNAIDLAQGALLQQYTTHPTAGGTV